MTSPGSGNHPAVSFISLGIRPGLVIALAIPLTLAIVFADGDHRTDMQRISWGTIIALVCLSTTR
jgi:hypothetical protein